MTTPTPLADRIRRAYALTQHQQDELADAVAALERENARMSKLVRIPETEQEVEALEEQTPFERALELLCSIRGVESVVVKHETLCAVRDRIASLERELAEVRERPFLIDCLAGKLTTYDQVFGYICKLEMEARALRSGDAALVERIDRCNGNPVLLADLLRDLRDRLVPKETP